MQIPTGPSRARAGLFLTLFSLQVTMAAGVSPAPFQNHPIGQGYERREGASLLDAITVMTRTKGRPGATSIVNNSGQLLGFFTDGDLRRLLEAGRQNINAIPIDEVMTRDPKSISPRTFALEALAFLHQHQVDQMPVVDTDNKVIGMLDVQDLLDLKIG